ncbi:MAG TPA: hypothetical protein VHQ65_16910 [Thermoanaerobaculia bacterium]|nr:hypothetical protein [Thermoanaerobaculia bacterium]
MRRALLVLSIAPLLTGCQFALGQNQCDQTAPRQASVAAAGVERLVVEHGAGKLTITGRSGTTVEARGTACGASAELLDQVQLRAERSGTTVEVEALYPEGGRTGLELTLEIPLGLAVEIRDGSGSLAVHRVASVGLDDGSGSVEIDTVGGAVRIEDGSGSIDVRNAGGPVWVTDGSGTTEIEQVTGDVTVEEDGSGSIRVRDVGGNVRVGSDGSGSITVTDVGGDFELGADGSGDVEVTGVEGEVRLPRD